MKRYFNIIILACIFCIISCKAPEDKPVVRDANSGPTKEVYGCIEGDCVNGVGTMIWENGSKYVGEFKNSSMHGKGTFYFGEGTGGSGGVYVGDFKRGFIEGNGTWTWPNGEKYVGETKHNKMHGKGIYYYSDGSFKEGTWFNDKYVEE